jgi:peptidoglycan/LPS O-acetylase OafA/YrhL
VLRGLGALVIVIGHVILLHPLASDRWNFRLDDLLEPLAIAGVSGFFTLSGFVLTWTVPPHTPARAFWRRRVARLLPVHAVTWALALATLAVAGISGAFWKMLPSLALINIWIPDLEMFWGPNTPSWTLSSEAFFYVLFPLLLLVAWRIPERQLYRLMTGVIGLVWLWAAAVWAVVPATHMISDGTPFSRTQYFAIVVFAPVRLLDFALGIILARIVIAGRIPGGLRPWVYLSVLGGYCASRWLIPQPIGFVAATMPAIAVGVLYSARADLAGNASRWATRSALWLGEISFSLYMVHWPVVYGGYHLLGEPTWTPLEMLGAGGAMVALSIALAQVIHTRVELPMYRRLRVARRTGNWPSAAMAARAAAAQPDGVASAAVDEPLAPGVQPGLASQPADGA